MNLNTPMKTRNDRRKKSAFTLVEMLLVLVILATLAAIVYPKVANRSEQARVTAAQSPGIGLSGATGQSVPRASVTP